MNRFAYVIFCDDIRNESGNKLSLMGVYNGQMFIQSMPTLLPKLGMSMKLFTSADKPVTTLGVRLISSAQDAPVLSIDMPPDDIKSGQREAIKSANEIKGDGEPRIEIGFVAVLPPFQVAQPMSLKAIIIADGEEIVAGRLHISLPPGPQKAATAPKKLNT